MARTVFGSREVSISAIEARREFRSPMIGERNCAGTVTSRFMIGSSRTRPAFFAASWNAIDPQMLNAMSDESTSWYLPSVSVILTSMTG